MEILKIICGHIKIWRCFATIFWNNYNVENDGAQPLDASHKRNNLYQCQVCSSYKWCFKEHVLCQWLVMKEAVCFSFLRLFVPQLNLHKIDSEEGWNYLPFAQTTEEQRDLRRLHLYWNCTSGFSFYCSDYGFQGIWTASYFCVDVHVSVS